MVATFSNGRLLITIKLNKDSFAHSQEHHYQLPGNWSQTVKVLFIPSASILLVRLPITSSTPWISR